MAQMVQKSISLFRGLLDVVLPPVCYVCGKSCSGKYGLCEICLGKIRRISPPYCRICGRHLVNTAGVCIECGAKKVYVERGWSCCDYEDTIKECIHLFKYKGYIGLVDVFRDIMSEFIRKNRIHQTTDLIVPVPTHPAKKRERTYNHAEVLGRALSKGFLMPFDSKNLKKIKWTSSQSELNKEKRLKNVEGSFLAVDKKIFAAKRVLIIDDVYTTGSTINECAKALKEAGARRVFSLALARGV